MEYVDLILENQNPVLVALLAAVGVAALTIFRFVRRLIVILSTVIAAPVVFFQQGVFTPQSVGHFEIASEQELVTVLLALFFGLLLGYLMPVGLNGGNRLVPSSIAPFGVYLVIGAMTVIIMHAAQIIEVSQVQELSVLGFIAGVASGFCFYSFVRFIDAAIPLCGWALVACLAIFSLFPRVGGSSLIAPFDLRLNTEDLFDTEFITDIETYMSELMPEDPLSDVYHSAVTELGTAPRQRLVKVSGAISDSDLD